MRAAAISASVEPIIAIVWQAISTSRRSRPARASPRASAGNPTASRFLTRLPTELLDQARRPGQLPAPSPHTPGALRAALHEHAVAANPVKIAPARFREGMRVRHGRYGDGTIRKSTMTRAGEEVIIHFDDVGLRIFAVRDARLEVLQT